MIRGVRVASDGISPPHMADQRLERGATVATMWRAVEELPATLRSALLLRDVAGLSYEEIAGALEVPLSTVKWRIFRARERVVLALSAADGIGRETEASK